MNIVTMIGRLTKDPEVSYANSGTTIGRFSLAVDRKFKQDGGPTADFFNCVTFGKKAEFVEKYLRKGTKVAIVGEIQNNNYTNKDGQKVYSTQILIDQIEFAESKVAAGQQTQQAAGGSTDWMNVSEGVAEELPFN